MKDVLNLGDIEGYLAHRAEKVATIKNVKTNLGVAQQIDFLKIDREEVTRYYIAVVFRGRVSDYNGKRLWLESRYLVEKEEGNRIFTEAKQGKTINIEEPV